MQERFTKFNREIGKRRFERSAEMRSQIAELRSIKRLHAIGRASPRLNGASFERLRLVRHDQIRIRLEPNAQTVTGGTGALRTEK